MKRLVLLFLLLALPFQTALPAAVGHCPQAGERDAHASVPHDTSHAGHAHENADGDDGGNVGQAAGSGLDCNGFQVLAIDPSAAPAPSLPLSSATVHDVEGTGYESHIPDGPDRPRWRFVV